VWAYLSEVIEDLVTLQTWKNKRNDTDLESIIFYERLEDLYRFLMKIKNQIALLPKNKYPSEKKRREILLRDLGAILVAHEQDYEDLTRIKGYLDKVKEILNAHEEPSDLGLEKLTELANELEVRLNSGKVTCAAEKDFLEKLCVFVFDRGESLFYYRDIENATNTNNPEETKFKTVKYGMKRTQGIASGSRYLQHHAKYLLFVDPNASREEIRQILMHADYKAIAQIIKEDRAKRKRPLLKIKDKAKWELRKKGYQEKLSEIE
jgi:hypothetical protein